MPKSGKPKVRAVKLLHPNSRKATKMTGSVMRKDRIGRVHNETAIKMGILVSKLQWFQERQDSDEVLFTVEDMSHLIESYLHRFDEELEQIDIIQGMKSRKGRQHAAREDVIRSTIKAERNIYNTFGFEVPDLTDKNNLARFREWDGTTKHAKLIKMKNFIAISTASRKATSHKAASQNTATSQNTDDTINRPLSSEVERDIEMT